MHHIHILGENLRLQRGRVNAIGMETLVDDLGSLQEVGNRSIRDDDMHGGEGFLLVETPDVELMDGVHSRNLFDDQLAVPVKNRIAPSCAPFRDHVGRHSSPLRSGRFPVESARIV